MWRGAGVVHHSPGDIPAAAPRHMVVAWEEEGGNSGNAAEQANGTDTRRKVELHIHHIALAADLHSAVDIPHTGLTAIGSPGSPGADRTAILENHHTAKWAGVDCIPSLRILAAEEGEEAGCNLSFRSLAAEAGVDRIRRIHIAAVAHTPATIVHTGPVEAEAHTGPVQVPCNRREKPFCRNLAGRTTGTRVEARCSYRRTVVAARHIRSFQVHCDLVENHPHGAPAPCASSFPPSPASFSPCIPPRYPSIRRPSRESDGDDGFCGAPGRCRCGHEIGTLKRSGICRVLPWCGISLVQWFDGADLCTWIDGSSDRGANWSLERAEGSARGLCEIRGGEARAGGVVVGSTVRSHVCTYYFGDDVCPAEQSLASSSCERRVDDGRWLPEPS